jgi:hypothetical protein
VNVEWDWNWNETETENENKRTTTNSKSRFANEKKKKKFYSFTGKEVFENGIPKRERTLSREEEGGRAVAELKSCSKWLGKCLCAKKKER